MQKVWFFDKPMIGYCPDCNEIATWDNSNGLHCPKCNAKEDDLSIFVWNEDSRYPA